MFLSGFSDPNWKALCTIINRPDLQQQFPTIFERLNVDNMEIMYKEIEKWTVAHTYDEIFDAVMEYNKNIGQGVVVPGRISSPLEAMKPENWWVRMALETIDDPRYGEVTIANHGHKMTETPPRVKWICRPVGADNYYVYARMLGYGPKRIEELKEKGIV